MEKDLCNKKTKKGKNCSKLAKILGMCTQHYKMYVKNSKNTEKNIIPVITITFGDVAENHVNMQKIGNIAEEGFQLEDLINAKNNFEKLGAVCELYDLAGALTQEQKNTLDENAYLLVIRNGVDFVLNTRNKIILTPNEPTKEPTKPNERSNELYTEHISLPWDTKAKMRGRVVNKRARYNLCYSNESQEPNYDEGKGRIISFNDVPMLNCIRKNLPFLIGEKAKNLQAEGNLYFDPSSCGIGFHGDAERRKVVALRLGNSMKLQYQWFQRFKPVGNRIEFILNHGDIYIMSSKAVGFDWKKSKTLTLRHAAGAKKYLTVKTKN